MRVRDAVRANLDAVEACELLELAADSMPGEPIVPVVT